MSVEITLTWSQAFQAAVGGAYLRLKSLSAGMKDTHPNAAEDGWTYQIEGVGGEIAFCAVMGIFFPFRVGTMSKPDVAGCEVRTMRKHDWDLKVKLDARDDVPHVLVTGRIPTFRVHGWAFGREAKREDWVRDFQDRGQPAYYVPQNELHTLDELRVWIAEHPETSDAVAVGELVRQPGDGE